MYLTHFTRSGVPPIGNTCHVPQTPEIHPHSPFPILELNKSLQIFLSCPIPSLSLAGGGVWSRFSKALTIILGLPLIRFST
jgi:hypothetical protein